MVNHTAPLTVEDQENPVSTASLPGRLLGETKLLQLKQALGGAQQVVNWERMMRRKKLGERSLSLQEKHDEKKN